MNKIKPVDSCGDELDQIPNAKVTAKPEPQNIQDQSNAQRFVLGQTVYVLKHDVADLPPGSKGKVNNILKNGRIIIFFKNDSCISLLSEAWESEESYLAADQVVSSISLSNPFNNVMGNGGGGDMIGSTAAYGTQRENAATTSRPSAGRIVRGLQSLANRDSVASMGLSGGLPTLG